MGEKKRWILEFMCNPSNKHIFIDITSEEFVNAYIEQFHPTITCYYPYGAPKVPEIAKLLSSLFKDGKVLRYRHYCDRWKDGYPHWFYIYFLKNE